MMSADVHHLQVRRRYRPDPEIPSEFVAPLPAADTTDDSGLIAAECRLAAVVAWWHAIDPPSEALSERLAEIESALEDFIADTPARTHAGIAVKVRRLAVQEAESVWQPRLVASALSALERFGGMRG